MNIGNVRKFFRKLTPLGRADREMREYLGEGVDEEKLQRYEKSYKRYRDLRLMKTGFKILFYASIITAVATTFGFDQIQVIQRIASYIGTSLIIILYGISYYFASVAKESYHVNREVLISENI